MIDADLFVGCLLIDDAVRPLGRRVGGVGVLFCVFVGLLSLPNLSLSLFPFLAGKGPLVSYHSVVSLSQSLITLGITSTSQITTSLLDITITES